MMYRQGQCSVYIITECRTVHVRSPDSGLDEGQAAAPSGPHRAAGERQVGTGMCPAHNACDAAPQRDGRVVLLNRQVAHKTAILLQTDK